MVMAPTGVAAFNIDGLTLHRALNLQVEHGRAAHQLKLNALALHELRRLSKGVHTIIVSYEVLLAFLRGFAKSLPPMTSLEALMLSLLGISTNYLL